MLTVVGVGALALIALALFLSLRLLLSTPESEVLASFADVYNNELQWSRVLAVLGMITAGPLSLWGALALVKGRQEPPDGLVLFSGLFVGALAGVCSWLPGFLWFLALVLPAVASLILVLVVLRIVPKRALGVWAVQQVIVVLVMSVWVIALERVQLGSFYNPFVEIPALMRYTSLPMNEGSVRSFDEEELPVVHGITWESTGSPWLDRRAGATRFTVEVDAPKDQLYFEIEHNDETLLYEPVTGTQWTQDFLVEPDTPYTISISSPKGTPGRASLEVAGLLNPK